MVLKNQTKQNKKLAINALFFPLIFVYRGESHGNPFIPMGRSDVPVKLLPCVVF